MYSGMSLSSNGLMYILYCGRPRMVHPSIFVEWRSSVCLQISAPYRILVEWWAPGYTDEQLH